MASDGISDPIRSIWANPRLSCQFYTFRNIHSGTAAQPSEGQYILCHFFMAVLSCGAGAVDIHEKYLSQIWSDLLVSIEGQISLGISMVSHCTALQWTALHYTTMSSLVCHIKMTMDGEGSLHFPMSITSLHINAPHVTPHNITKGQGSNMFGHG